MTQKPTDSGIQPPLADADLLFIRQAVAYLEQPGFLQKAANLLGRPTEALIERLPQRVRSAIARAVQKAMEQALSAALYSLEPTGLQARLPTDGTMHTAAAAATGFLGGFFGAAGLPVELPLTTMLMLRSIAHIARENGADLADPEVRLECLAVLALGGQMASPIDAELDGALPTSDISAMESAYYSSRIGLGMAMRSAARFAAGRTAVELTDALAHGSAPALVRLVAIIAARFNIVVGEKAMAQAVPLLGAAAGAALNAAFMEHFNAVARYHFGLRRMERRHGESIVRQAYARSLEVHKA